VSAQKSLYGGKARAKRAQAVADILMARFAHTVALDEPYKLEALVDQIMAATSPKKALAGNVGGQAREQEVWTPDWIVEAAREALGGTIDVDPCAASKSEAWFATYNITAGPHIDGYRTESIVFEGGRGGWISDSLRTDWASDLGHFVNPPYQHPAYQLWLEKCAAEAAKGARIVLLGPTRPNRKWFRPALRAAEVVELNYKVIFKGHDSAFPASLFLASWNCRLPDLGDRENGRIPPTLTRG
jgi:hypothetical protein